MKKLLLLLFAAFCFAPAVNAQVSDDDEAMAYRLKRKYPDNTSAVVSDIEEYRFAVDKGDNNQPLVTAQMNQRVQFISLREATMLQYGEYYNKFSSITKIKQYYKVGNSFQNYTAKNKPLDQSVTTGDIFYDDSRVKYFNIVLPKMGMGAAVDIEKQFTDAKYVVRTMFHDGYPTLEKTIRFRVPSNIELDLREINFKGYNIVKSTTTEGKETVYSFTLRDAAPLMNEEDALPATYTYPHIIVLVKSFTADGQQQAGFQSVADLYKWYNYLYGKCNNQPSVLKPKVEELVRGKSNDLDKVKSIYYWVQDNIRYIAFEDGYAGFVPQTAQDVYKNKYGDCKGMANLLTEMLKLAGYDAHLTWIGTRHIPYTYQVPSLCVDNHCICTLYLNGKTYFLDGTEKFGPLGEYAYRIQGKETLVSKGASYEVAKVPMADSSQSKLITKASFVLNDNVLKGHLIITLTGEERTNFHQLYQDMPTDKKKEALQRILEFGNDNIYATNIKTSDLTNREIPVVIEGDIDLSNNIIREDKEVYAGIDFFPKRLRGYMPDAKRVNPYDFGSIFSIEDQIELTIPGYKMKDLPEAFNEQTADYGFSGSYSQVGNKIILKKNLSIKTGTVKKEDFTRWSEFLKKLRDFDNNVVMVEKDPNYTAPAATPVKTAEPVKTAPKTATKATPAKPVPAKKQ